MKDFIQAILITAIAIATMAGFLYLATAWFTKVDCNNARNGLDFIQRCEANEDCKLSAHELDLKRVYTRLEIKRCPKD